MILEYDRKMDATIDDKLKSLMESTQLALNDVITAQKSANDAKADAQTAQESADSAMLSASTAINDASLARDAAQTAQESADSAMLSASTAINQLGYIEDVVGALNWIASHGTYKPSEDTEVQDGKLYFTLSGDVYTAVTESTGNPSEQGWYELDSVDEAVSNYIASHLALDNKGLILQTNGSNSKVRLSTEIGNEGVILYGADGAPVAKYGSETVIGNEDGFHLLIDGQEIGFYQSAYKVAYINNNQLYITQAEVLQQMDLGAQIVNGGLGQWTWMVHDNGRANNLTLKWNR